MHKAHKSFPFVFRLLPFVITFLLRINCFWLSSPSLPVCLASQFRRVFGVAVHCLQLSRDTPDCKTVETSDWYRPDLCLFTLHPDREPPDVDIETENTSFTTGVEVDLSCRIKLTSTRSFAAAKWIRRDPKQTLKTANFSYDVNRFHYSFSHVIHKVSTYDAGYYTCVVNFDGHGSQNVSYKLRVTGKSFLSRSLVFYCAPSFSLL